MTDEELFEEALATLRAESPWPHELYYVMECYTKIERLDLREALIPYLIAHRQTVCAFAFVKKTVRPELDRLFTKHFPAKGLTLRDLKF